MEHELRALLFTALRDFGQAAGIAVAYENKKFEPGVDAYLELQIFPVSPELFGVTTGWSRYQWIFQVSVFVRDGVGAYKSSAIVDQLRAAFPYAHKFSGDREYQVSRPADSKPPVRVKGWYATPVHFRVQTIA